MSSEEAARAIDLLGRVPYGRVATSMRALPFVAPARHVVTGGRVLLRLHAGLGYHHACLGSVVAYGADNLNSGAEHLWSVQFTGTAEPFEPTAEELALFGPRAPRGGRRALRAGVHAYRTPVRHRPFAGLLHRAPPRHAA